MRPRNIALAWLCLLAFCVAISVTWPDTKPHYKTEQPNYRIKQFCEEHPDVCKRGIRTVVRPPRPDRYLAEKP